MENNELLSQIASLIHEQTEVLDTRFQQIDNRLDNIEGELTEVKVRLTNVENRLTDVENRLTNVENRVTNVENQLTEVKDRLTDVEALAKKNATELQKTQIMIENDVTMRIDALFDGYKLNHELQKRLEDHVKGNDRQIDNLQVRVAVIESKHVG